MSNTPSAGRVRMSMHRVLQLSVLLDTASNNAGQCRRAAFNLAQIRNDRGAGHYLRRTARFERVAARCEGRLAHA